MVAYVLRNRRAVKAHNRLIAVVHLRQIEELRRVAAHQAAVAVRLAIVVARHLQEVALIAVAHLHQVEAHTAVVAALREALLEVRTVAVLHIAEVHVREVAPIQAVAETRVVDSV